MELDRATVDQVALQSAVDDLGDLGPARTDEAGDADDLARVN